MKIVETDIIHRVQYEISYLLDGTEFKINIVPTKVEIFINDLIEEIITHLIYSECCLEDSDVNPRIKSTLSNYFRNNIKIISFRATKTIKTIRTSKDDPSDLVEE